MNIYLISQSVNSGYDTFDSAVVAAESERDARNTYPQKSVDVFWDGEHWMWHLDSGALNEYVDYGWTTPENVTVELIGTTTKSAGVICASFNNAG